MEALGCLSGEGSVWVGALTQGVTVTVWTGLKVSEVADERSSKGSRSLIIF